MARCGSCGALMVWVKTKSAAMPLDAHEERSGATERSAMVAVPTVFDDGNIVLDDGVARVKALGDEGPFYQSHFVTCPEAKQWRKR